MIRSFITIPLKILNLKEPRMTFLCVVYSRLFTIRSFILGERIT